MFGQTLLSSLVLTEIVSISIPYFVFYCLLVVRYGVTQKLFRANY